MKLFLFTVFYIYVSLTEIVPVIFLKANGNVVTLSDGDVNGTIWTSRKGKLFNAFLGIPFAKPPDGPLRFNPPQKNEPWNGTLDATFPKSACIQTTQVTHQLIGTEDCLYLNVYSPINATKGDKLPVIFFIFGGAFNTGHVMQNGPEFFMVHDFIMIQSNYRLGVLGFLSTGDDVLPGNYAMRDQILAMQWTQQNIEEFGGDPQNVTLMGHSSGAACVHLHLVSPLSKGLFHKVIMQSGVAAPNNNLYGPDISRALAHAIGRGLGCDITSSHTLLNCVMNMKPEALVDALNEGVVWDMDPESIIRPTVEGRSSKNAFLPDFPHKLKYHSPELPLLIGLTSEEGAYKVARYLSEGGYRARIINEEYKYLLPIILYYYWDTKKEHAEYTTDIVRRHYFHDAEIGEDTKKQFVRMMSDGMVSYRILDIIKTYPGIKYAYMYNYRANFSTQNIFGYYPDFLGISHAAEVHIMFRRNESINYLTEGDLTFGGEMITRWINFVNSGNPNTPNEIDLNLFGHWEPVTSNKTEYLRINLNGTMESDLFANCFKFWSSLPVGSKYF